MKKISIIVLIMIMFYIITCNYKGVEKKLNQGEKVNQIFKKSGKTPLMIAATLPNFKDAIKMSQILIKEGADVNKKDIYGANVLFYVGYYDYEKRTSEDGFPDSRNKCAITDQTRKRIGQNRFCYFKRG